MSVVKNIQDLVDSRELYGRRTEGPWERARIDEAWWRALSLPLPPPPIKGIGLLFPLSSFDDLVNTHREMSIPLDNYWMRSVLSPTWATNYFFKWFGAPQALVLAVFGFKNLTVVECLARGDKPVPLPYRAQILANVIQAFSEVGFEVKKAERKVRRASLN